ncbi:hypothetical protein LTR17_020069 [Elasticomyces elasticus]|nr:hypothetical protein LTR17_020069 [Elasticomyces elasticus]
MADINDPFGSLQSALRGDPSPSTTHQHRTGLKEAQPQPTANTSNDARTTQEDWLIKHDRFGGAKESDVSLPSLEQKRYCRIVQMRPRDFIVVEMLLLGRMLELVKQPDLPLWWRTSMVQNIWAQLKELQQSGKLYHSLHIGKCAAAMTFLCEMWCRKIGRFGSDATVEIMEKFVKTFRILLDTRLRERGQVPLSES